MKKKSLLMMVSILLMVSSSFASKPPEAWSVGTDYDDGFFFGGVNTTEDAITAADFYGGMGFDSDYSIAPTYKEMRGKTKSGTYRLESDIQFYSGHANHQSVAYNHEGLGGEYKTGVFYGKNYDTATGYKFAGLSSYDLEGVSLMTFAGCNTASNGDDNIAAKAHQLGAKVTVGWTVPMGASSHSKWLERYNRYLNEGYTVQKALDYADSFNYLDNRVKKHKTYGDTSVRFKGVQTFRLEKRVDRPYYVVRASEVDAKLLKLNPSYKREDYVVETTEGEDATVYDYYLKVDGIKSTQGYTVVVEGKIAKVYENTVETPQEGEALSAVSWTAERMDKSFDEGQYTILSKEPIYDTVAQKKKMYYRVEHTLEEGLTAVIEYYEDL